MDQSLGFSSSCWSAPSLRLEIATQLLYSPRSIDPGFPESCGLGSVRPFDRMSLVPRDALEKAIAHISEELWRQHTARAATSNSPTRGQVKIPQLTAAGRCDDYPAEARLATRSAASLRRQLLPSNFSRFPRCMSRSRSGATTTTSPNSFGQSSIGRFEVNSVEDLS
jgi:hypothetical protein